MPTPASGTSPYCSTAQFVEFVDTRNVQDLLSDSGAPVTAGALATNATLLLQLGAASGKVEASATAGGFYVIDPNSTPPRNDLSALTGNSSNYLAWLVAQIAWYLVWARRPSSGEPPPTYEMAQEDLELLRNGRTIFGILENQAAGQVNVVQESPAVWDNRMGPVTLAREYFGTRTKDRQANP